MCEEGFQMKGSEVLSQGSDGKVEKREMGQERIWRWSYLTCRLFTCFPEEEARIQPHSVVSNLVTRGGEQGQVWKGRF